MQLREGLEALDCPTLVHCSVQNEVDGIAAALLARGKIVLDTRSCLPPLVPSPRIIVITWFTQWTNHKCIISIYHFPKLVRTISQHTPCAIILFVGLDKASFFSRCSCKSPFLSPLFIFFIRKGCAGEGGCGRGRSRGDSREFPATEVLLLRQH